MLQIILILRMFKIRGVSTRQSYEQPCQSHIDTTVKIKFINLYICVSLGQLKYLVESQMANDKS